MAISDNTLSSLYQTAGAVFGIRSEFGFQGTIDNNMIDLGLTASGAPAPLTSSTPCPTGIRAYGYLDCLHNSVYIHPIAGSTLNFNGACLLSDTSSKVIANNILEQNLSGNVTGLALIGLPFGNNSNIYCDYNLYYLCGSGSLGSIGTIDLHSRYGNPLFIQPETGWSDIDLHLQQGTPAESAGTADHTTLTDIDGKLRVDYTPVDIGADAGNFKIPGSSSDSTLPVDSISFIKAFPNPVSGSVTLAVYAPQSGTAAISIFSVSGMLIKTDRVAVTAGNNNINIPVETLAPGAYLIEVEIGSRKKLFN